MPRDELHPVDEERYDVKLRSARLLAAIAALALLGMPAATTPAAADPIDICTPDGSTCVAAAVAAEPCDATAVCVRSDVSAATCLPGLAGCAAADAQVCAVDRCRGARATVCPLRDVDCVSVEANVEPLGGIERPATGIITISEIGGVVSHTLSGVFAPAAGEFSCVLDAPPWSERTVRCTPLGNSYDWYCAGWIVTATTHIYQSQVAGQASCSGFEGFPGQSNDRTLWTNFACCNQTETTQAIPVTWFVSNAITCQAWGYSAGPHPMGDWTVTCNEPGANAPG